MTRDGKYRTSKQFQEDLEYGQFAEKKIGDFLERNGWNVRYSEEFGEMYDFDKFKGPRLCLIPPWVSPSASIEEIEVSCIYLIAPDIMSQKPGRLEFIEVKRKIDFSWFNGEKVFYIDKEQYDHYSTLNLYFAKVYLFLYISTGNEDENYEVYWVDVSRMDANIQYKARDYYGFNKNILKKINID